MHLLPCSNCQNLLPVTPSQAGDEVTCSECQAEVSIPKLGVLRQLPLAEDPSEADSAKHKQGEGGVSVVFVALGLLTVAGFIVAAFCGIRWVLIPNLSTTDEHVADLRADYAERSSAELIREYEQMVGDGIELGKRFTYKRIADEKQRWGQIAGISGGIGLLAAIAAFGFAAVSRRRGAA
nr:hypothetical protein [Rubripirellula sp.]